VAVQIIYANKSVTAILGKAEEDIRKQLPDFSALIWSAQILTVFTKNPSHQAQMLDSLNTAHSASIEVGDRLIALTARPVINDDDQRLANRSRMERSNFAELAEKEVNAAIHAAIIGDFTKRIEIQGKDGFFKQLGRDLTDFWKPLKWPQ